MQTGTRDRAGLLSNSGKKIGRNYNITMKNRQTSRHLIAEQDKALQRFIKDHRSLFWYIKEDAKERISTEFLVETILNYGELKDVKKLLALVGTKRTAEIFFKQTRNKRCNYFPKVKNYFTHYFHRHA